MEEEKKNEEESTNVVNNVEEKDEKYFELKRSNNRKKACIVILLFLLVLAGLLLFIFFSDKKEEPKKEDNKQEEKQEENKQEEQKQEEPEETEEDFGIKNGIELTNTNKIFVVNGNTINLRLTEGAGDSGFRDLYVNDTKVEEKIFVDHAISMDKYLLIYGQNSQCGIEITHYIDENSKVNKIENNLTTEEVQYLAVKDVDGTFNAHITACPEYKAELDFDVKFVYTNNKLQVVKAD